MEHDLQGKGGPLHGHLNSPILSDCLQGRNDKYMRTSKLNFQEQEKAPLAS